MNNCSVLTALKISVEFKQRKKKMNIGNILSVEYATGEKFTGKVVSFKYMPGERLLFTMEIENVGFRSMYLDKCVACDYIGFVEA